MPLNAADLAIGDLLVQRKLMTPAQLDDATGKAGKWGVRLADVLLAHSWVRPLVFYQTLAQHFDLAFVNLMTDPPDETLLDEHLAGEYTKRLVIPWRTRNGRILIATAQPGPDTILFARQQWGPDIDFVVTSKFDIIWQVQRIFRSQHSQQAVYELSEIDPEMSARRVVTPVQAIWLFISLSILLAGLAFAPIGTLIAVNVAMSVFYLGNFIFKGLLVWVGAKAPAREVLTLDIAARLLREEEMPTYTILVPMFREPEVLPILAHALRQLDYPLAKLDIKIVLEEGDHETIDATKALGLEGVFEIIRVPPSMPQTKPKACNYALKFARGELLVIYDAEDKPEPDQLRKVVAAFQAAPANTACIQCRLNYYNSTENWLTRMFTLDYALWFDLMLPGLERLNLPIPLGGTSNHFKIDVLRELHAWDPFNVTEDADLGIRMTQKGYRVGIIDSTTYEEANCATGNWIRQRSRWIKGYMQTFLVHSRRPVSFVRDHGLLPALGFVFFIGGTMLSGLLNPLFWGIFLAWLITGTAGFTSVFPPVLLCLALFNLLLGNGLFIYLTMIAPFRRGWLELTPYGLTVFWYWMLTSIAAFKGLWQLIVNPFYWEKTQHGISTHTAAQVAHAKSAEAGSMAL
jgi:cellulose synthase/poly-beta-1,6-N-acetylglucosamine synthase-like glycosyltransferase